MFYVKNLYLILLSCFWTIKYVYLKKHHKVVTYIKMYCENKNAVLVICHLIFCQKD